jgi:cytochrome c-type biogenesis protein CcmH/NrfF
MSMHMCDRKEQLIGFLYGELDRDEAADFQRHLLTCAECRGEFGELRATRGQIAAWTPPEPDLGFQVVRAPAAPAPRFRIPPAWGLAAAAVLVMAVGAAIANLDVRVGGGEGLVIRTGWNHGAAAAVDNVAVQSVDWKEEAQQLDARLRQMEQSLARTQSGSIRNTSGPAMTAEEMLQRVRDMLAQSESRQQRILAARLLQITRDYDAKRRVDLAAIDQGMSRLQSTSGAEVRQYRDLIQRMYRATAYQQTK